MIFIDTNYFLRFLLEDNAKQFEEAKELFIKASEGNEKALTSTIVIFEIYWVLSSFYGKNKSEIALTLKNILSLDFIKLSERKLLLSAVSTFEKTSLDLEDSYNLVFAKSKKANKIATFDIKLQKLFKKV